MTKYEERVERGEVRGENGERKKEERENIMGRRKTK